MADYMLFQFVARESGRTLHEAVYAIRDNGARINGVETRDPNTALKAGDVIEWTDETRGQGRQTYKGV
jgi:hypothetical protein